MPLFGPFVDKKGPVVPAAMMNALDLIQNALSIDTNGGLTLAAPTVAEPSLTINTFSGQPAIVANGTGGIALGSLSGGVLLSQNISGQMTFNNLANQAYEFLNGSLEVFTSSGVPAALSLAGNGDILANALTLQYGSDGRGHILFQNKERLLLGQTGNWTFDAETSGLFPTVVINTPVGAQGLEVLSNSALPGGSLGVLIGAGTSAFDGPLTVNNQANTQTFFSVNGLGTLFGNGPFNQSVHGPHAPLLDMTPDYGSFTGTLLGFASAVAATFVFFKIGSFVWIYFPGANVTGTSNAVTMALSGVPQAIWSTAAVQNVPVTQLIDVGVVGMGSMIIGVGGVYNFTNYTVQGSRLASGLFTASGSKGIATGFAFGYSLI